MNTPNLTEAYVTKDGFVASIAAKSSRERHRSYGTDAWGVKLVVPLFEDERRLAQYLQVTRWEAGRVLPHVRSTFAQLGADIGDDANPDRTQIKLEGNTIIIDTVCTSLTGKSGEGVIDHVRRMVYNRREAFLARCSILPNDARVGEDELVRQGQNGELSARGAWTRDGRLAMPLQPHAFSYKDDVFQPKILDAILSKKGSGRSRIFESRTQHTLRATLPAGHFFVGGIDIHAKSSHVILEPQTWIDNETVSTGTHLSALCLDAGRTVDGDRQVEIRANGHPVDLRRLWVRASLYRAAKTEEAGV